jgi:hypothetical protein
MEIIGADFLEIYSTAFHFAAGYYGWFRNIAIMKAELLDAMSVFRFAVLEKRDKRVDRNRLDIALGEPIAVRYAAFLGVRLTLIFMKHLKEPGKKTGEFPIVSIAPRGSDVIATKTKAAHADAETKGNVPIKPAFTDKTVAAIQLASNNKYSRCCGDMIQPIIDSANSETKYDVVIVVGDIQLGIELCSPFALKESDAN